MNQTHRLEPIWRPCNVVCMDRNHADVDQPEGVDRAACSGNILHLARSALRAAEDGARCHEWREIASEDVAPKLLVRAEECMREAGLWPWASIPSVCPSLADRGVA